MKQINLEFSFSRPRNPEHYQLHNDLLAAITAEFVAALGIAPLREEYRRLFDIENDCYLRNTAYQETPEVEEKDRRRDDLFLYVSQFITTATLSPVEATATAARRLEYYLAPYRDAPRMNYASNTAAVTDFVEKMRESANAADIATLGLTAAVDALDTANKDFNTLYTGRSSELLARSTSETMKTIRPKVDAAFKSLASAVNAIYQVNELVTKDAAKEAEIGAVIDRANALIIQLQTTLSRAGAGVKPGTNPDAQPDSGNTGGSPETPETPVTPEPPVTPETPGGGGNGNQEGNV